MPRDWDREELLLRMRADAAFTALMGIDPAAVAFDPGTSPHYTADVALAAYQDAQSDLAAFIAERRANDPKGARA